MKNNQINLFTQPSTSTNDLSEMDLKLKLLNQIHLKKSNETHTTHHQLYDTLYESITLDQDAEPSFHKSSHDNHDLLNNHEGENRKKRRKDVDIDKNENHILGPSIVAIAKKLKELIQKNELTIADLEVLIEAKWNSDEDDVSKPRSFKRHMSKNTKLHPFFYNSDFYYLVCLSTKEKYTTSITKHYAARYYIQGIEDIIPDRWCKETHCYHFEALNGIHHWEDSRIDFFKAKMSTRTEGNVYSDLRIKSVVRIMVKKK
ncbi:hypothetical protein Tco_0361129 [Tanacetum coccineum]